MQQGAIKASNIWTRTKGTIYVDGGANSEELMAQLEALEDLAGVVSKGSEVVGSGTLAKSTCGMGILTWGGV